MLRKHFSYHLIASLCLVILLALFMVPRTAWASVSVGPSNTADQTSQNPQNPVNYGNLAPQGSLQQGTTSNVLGDSTGGVNFNTLSTRALAVAQTGVPAASGSDQSKVEIPQSKGSFGKILGWLLIGGFVAVATGSALYLRNTMRRNL